MSLGPTDITQEIYIDETSQNGHRFLVLGGIILPTYLSNEFDAHIMKVRATTKLAVHLTRKMTLSEMGWNCVSKNDFDAYRTVIDAYFSFGSRLKSSLTKFGFYCSVVDTHVEGRHYTGKRGEIGFDREIYYHCMSIARRQRDSIFHVYPDERSTSQSTGTLRSILNHTARREHLQHHAPFRRLQFCKSHDVQALQVSDLLIGAIAYRLNRHFDQAGGHDKKRLCQYILEKGGFWKLIHPASFKEKSWGRFVVWFRRHKT